MTELPNQSQRALNHGATALCGGKIIIRRHATARQAELPPTKKGRSPTESRPEPEDTTLAARQGNQFLIPDIPAYICHRLSGHSPVNPRVPRLTSFGKGIDPPKANPIQCDYEPVTPVEPFVVLFGSPPSLTV
jgi:hypothetical protein